MPDPLRAAQFRALLDEYLAPVLVARGFKSREKGTSFRLIDGDCEYDVGMLSRSDRAGDVISLDLYATVGFRSLWKHMRQAGLFKDRERSVAGIGGNAIGLGIIPRSSKTPWNWIDSQFDVESAGSILRQQLEQHVIPFLERASDIRAAMRYWSREDASATDKYALASALTLKNDSAGARRVIDELEAAILADSDPDRPLLTERMIDELKDVRTRLFPST